MKGSRAISPSDPVLTTSYISVRWCAAKMLLAIASLAILGNHFDVLQSDDLDQTGTSAGFFE